MKSSIHTRRQVAGAKRPTTRTQRAQHDHLFDVANGHRVCKGRGQARSSLDQALHNRCFELLFVGIVLVRVALCAFTGHVCMHLNIYDNIYIYIQYIYTIYIYNIYIYNIYIYIQYIYIYNIYDIYIYTIYIHIYIYISRMCVHIMCIYACV